MIRKAIKWIIRCFFPKKHNFLYASTYKADEGDGCPDLEAFICSECNLMELRVSNDEGIWEGESYYVKLEDRK